ncbi:putative acyl---UDP-N-acetylglucosamine-O-acyltransferase [Podospora australis]|uniref:Acyl---UDP-N-acetylglucosamine-O-acyltransferase n=1 Tax=Podospora australis TaxID=1536484 RepID=A0AAN6WUY8_9PEZI|nr:putative acyl---UDP-N-acetylglucosamine-O-acyltransferase [Podospora australis]
MDRSQQPTSLIPAININQNSNNMFIHPTAIISPGATIHPTASIGPFCHIGPLVTLGPHTTLLSHVTVSGQTTIGSNCTIHPFSALGGPSQAKADSPTQGTLSIGNNCIIRECATVNLGLGTGTKVGNGVLIMANAHVAHDCFVDDEVILVNGVTLAGHVTVGKGAIFAGQSAAVQFCRIGEFAYVGAGTMVSRDVLPFSLVRGDRARTVGVNVVGLRRRGWVENRMKLVEKAMGLVLRGDERGLGELLGEIKGQVGGTDVLRLAEFARGSEKGLCLPPAEKRPEPKL